MQGSRRVSAPGDWRSFAQAYVAFGADLWGGSWKLGSGYLQRAADEAVRFGLDPQPGGDLLRTLLTGLGNYCGELATLYPVALDKLSRRLDSGDDVAPSAPGNPVG